MVGVDAQRLLRAEDSLGELALVVEREREHHVVLRIEPVRVDQFLEQSGGFLGALQLDQNFAEPELRFRSRAG